MAVKSCVGKGRQRRFHVCLRPDGALGRQVLESAFLPSFDLRLEQIGRARHRQQQNERDDEQPGIEMPAPDRGIDGLPAGVRGHSRPSHLRLSTRSEEHTSELQSLLRISYAVFCLKKKYRIHTQHTHILELTNT